MSRPKESLFGLVAGMASLYTANKARKLSHVPSETKVQKNIYHVLHNDMSGIEDQMRILSSEIKSNTIHQNNLLSTIQTSSCFTIQGLVNIFHSVENLSQQQWEVLNFMNEMDRKEEVLGTLRMFLFNVEKELERIEILFKTFPEFSFLMMQDLEHLFLSKKISQDKFKRMPIEEFRWANSVMENVTQQSNLLARRIQHNPVQYENALELREKINKIAESEEQLARISENMKKLRTDYSMPRASRNHMLSNYRYTQSKLEKEIPEYWEKIMDFIPNNQSNTDLIDKGLEDSDL